MVARILLSLCTVLAVHASQIGCVVPGKSEPLFKPGVWDDNAISWGNYSDWKEHKSGFGVLNIKTRSASPSGTAYSDALQMKAAGLLEGMLTIERVKNHHGNMRSWMLGQLGLDPAKNASADFPPVFKTFMHKQDTWMRQQINNAAAAAGGGAQKKAKDDASTWQHVGLILSQFDGLVLAGATAGISKFELQMLNGLGDFFDLLPTLVPSRAKLVDRWSSMVPEELMRTVTETSRCSGLIKVTADLSEIYAGHSTFFIYPQMLRIYKHYSFALQLGGGSGGGGPASNANAKTVGPSSSSRLSFSSYPGLLSSIDDFYVMQSANMAMVQTTNSVFDKTLYEKYVRPESLLAWHRVRAACQLARGGEEWSKVIDFHNSGTYNNQYMVIDYKIFDAGKKPTTATTATAMANPTHAALLPGVLWVSEQIPGTVAYADVTQQLERGYWPSYNVPYFPDIYNKSGYPKVLAHFAEQAAAEAKAKAKAKTGAKAKHSDAGAGADVDVDMDVAGAVAAALEPLAGLEYQTAPRADIFRRDQASVVDLRSFQALLRSNDYKHDPLAHGDADRAICIRGDLSARKSDGGCLDTKVTMGAWVKGGRAAAVNGPTRGGTGPFLRPIQPAGPRANGTSGGNSNGNSSVLLPAFTWESVPDAGLHTGLPDTWEFEFEEMAPAAWLCT